MACSVSANGTTLNCACSGCGILYNHSTKKYHILCCGETFELSSKFDVVDDDDPPGPGHVVVDLKDALMIDAIKLLENFAPGGVEIDQGFKPGDRVTLRMNEPVEEVGRKLGVRIGRGAAQQGA